MVYGELRVVEIITIDEGKVTEVMDTITHNQYFNDEDSGTKQFELLQTRINNKEI
jgi:hypothetical protein